MNDEDHEGRMRRLSKIDVAIKLFLSGEFVSSITLSGAAEDSLPDVDVPHLLPILRSGWAERKVSKKSLFSEIRNWLKHNKNETTTDIDTDDAVIMLVRAISKYTAVFDEKAETDYCEQFCDWMRIGPTGLTVRATRNDDERYRLDPPQASYLDGGARSS